MSAVTFGLDELKEILVERIGVVEDTVPHDTATSFADLGLDSLARVELVLAIQQDLGLRVPEEASQRFITLQDPIDYVNEQLAGGAVILDGAH
ncbi:MAG: acyl carrier protein [bacterium]|jgi:acyl carrier protein|nr:acyl carrier protein [Solirubrobacteraceae bacterium]